MAQTKKSDATVDVRLLCILSGGSQDWGPGDVIKVDAPEAARLIALGAAVAVK